MTDPQVTGHDAAVALGEASEANARMLAAIDDQPAPDMATAKAQAAGARAACAAALVHLTAIDDAFAQQQPPP